MSKQIKRIKAMLALICVVGLMIVSMTVAYLFMRTSNITNNFIGAFVQSKVIENFDGTTKTNVLVKNEGNVDAYVRAYVVVYWMDEDGHIYHEKPVLDDDYSIDYDDSKWILGDDGYWYYPEILSEMEESSILINEATCISDDIPSDYQLAIEIISSGIQANPQDVVESNWNVTINNEVLTPN